MVSLGKVLKTAAFRKIVKAHKRAEEAPTLGEEKQNVDYYRVGPRHMTKPQIIGCQCGNTVITKEWDNELGTYYYYYECKKCGYYWEGPIYVGD